MQKGELSVARVNFCIHMYLVPVFGVF